MNIGQRTGKPVAHNNGKELNAKLISRRVVSFLRRKIRFHEIDGACLHGGDA